MKENVLAVNDRDGLSRRPCFFFLLKASSIVIVPQLAYHNFLHESARLKLVVRYNVDVRAKSVYFYVRNDLYKCARR